MRSPFLFCLIAAAFSSSVSGVTTLTVGLAGDNNATTLANDAGAFVSTASTTANDLRGTLNYINLVPGSYAVVFNLSNPTITLTRPLPIINMNATNALTIDGSNNGSQITINGAGAYRPFLIRQGTAANPVTIQNMTLSNCRAQGGNGGTPGGGGGLGAGGGVFVDAGCAVNGCFLNNLTFTSCAAVGGNGGSSGNLNLGNSLVGGGGGGLGGGAGGANGGVGFPNVGGETAGPGGGGGFFGNGASGGGGAPAPGAGGAGGGGGALGNGGAGGPNQGSQTGGGGGGGGATVFSTGAMGGFGMAGNATSAGSSAQILGGTLFVGGGGGAAGGQAGGGSSAGGGNGGAGNNNGGLGGGTGGGGGSNCATCSNAGMGAAGTTTLGGLGGSGGGGGGAGENTLSVGGTGGNGGGGGGSDRLNPGGTGGYGGGGGGGAFGTGGAGGFGGGGGGGSIATPTIGGAGGFGGGGGAPATTGGGAVTPGAGGFGAGSAGSPLGSITTGGIGGGTGDGFSNGGGGAGLGGAIFAYGWVQLGSTSGITTSNSATISGTGGTGASFQGVSTAGNGVLSGTASDFMILSGTYTTTSGTMATGAGVLNLNPLAGATNTISGSIGDDSSNTLNGSNNSVGGTAPGGSVAQNGPGTTALNGVNTYAGGTTINAGTLQINSNASLGLSTTALTFGGNGTLATTGTFTSPRSINLGANTATFNASSGTTFTASGMISGTGTAVIAGPGTVIFTGANNYSGGTQINQGTLGFNSASNLGTGGVTFTGNGTMQFGMSGTFTFPSLSINSGASATFNPAGNTVVLGTAVSGNGSMTVISTPAGGTLQAGVQNAFPSSSPVSVGAGATLSLGGFNTSFGSLTGAGNLALGSGNLTLGGDNSTPPPFTGVISGSGTLTKIGTGTITLAGNNTYTGLTSVNAGRLNITGSITGPIIVYSGGNLGGTGDVGNSVIVESGGQITPGTSIGTLTMSGLTLNGGAITNLEITTNASSVLAINGSASLGGTLNVVVDPGTYSPNTYTILTASGGLSGTFSSLTFSGSSSGLSGSLSYQSNAVLLSLLTSSSSSTSAAQAAALAAVGGLGGLAGSSNPAFLNAIDLGNYLAAFSGNPAFTGLLAILFSLPSKELLAALNSITPARNGFSALTNINNLYSISNVVGIRMSNQRSLALLNRRVSNPKRLAKMDPFSPSQLVAENKKLPQGNIKKAALGCDEQCFWFDGGGNVAKQNSQNQMPNMNFHTENGLVGYDFFGFEHGMLGLMGGYAFTNYSFTSKQGNGTIQSYFFGPYASGYFYDGFVEFGLFGSFNLNKNQRHITFPSFDAWANSTHRSVQLMPHFAVGYDYDRGDQWAILEPFASLDWVLDWEQRFKEQGAYPLNMTSPRAMISMLRAELGVRLYETIERDWGITVVREVVGYVNKTPFGTSGLDAAIVNAASFFTPPAVPPTAFNFQTFTQTQNLLTIGFELLIKGNNGWFGTLDYDGEFLSGYVSNQGQASLGIFF